MSNDILIDDSSAMAGNLVASVEAIANAVKDSGASFTSAFENLSKDFNSGFSRFIDSSKSMNSELLKALNSLKINITQNFKSSNAKAKSEGEKVSSIFDAKLDKYFSGATEQRELNAIAQGLGNIYAVTEKQLSAMSKSGGKTKGQAPDFADVFKPVETKINDSIYGLQEESKRSADLLSGVFDPIYNVSKSIETFGIASEKPSRSTESFEPQMSGEYSTYGVRGGEKGVRRRRKITPEMLMELNDTAIPAPEARDIPLSVSELKGLYSQKTDHEGRPVTTTKGMMPSLFSQISGDMQKAGSEFGKILTPIFGNLGGIFGKSIAPFFTNPIAQVGKNLMQSGLQTAAGGAQGFGAFGGAGAMVGGAATAALGVGVVGFGAALTAVTTSVKMAGQAINSMASYVAKFSPATAEQMNLVFNDLQAVIGKALLPVFNAAIPIVRQFADFINFAMNALTPSIGIVTEAFQTIIPPLIELGATLIDAFMPVIRFAVSLLKGLAMVLEPIINGFAVLVDAVSMMFEIFTQGMDITQLMIDGFKLIADTTNFLVGAFNWVIAAFYAGVGTLMKVLAEAIDWVDGPGQRSWSKGIMEMGDQAIAGAKKIQTVSEEQMQAGLEGKKFSYKAGSLKGKEDIKKNSSFGMAVREAQAMSIESLGDTIRKAAITAQAPESQDKQEEYMKTVSENTAYEKQKKAMVDAIKESGLVDNSNQAIDFGKPDTTYSGGGGDFEVAAPFVG